MMREDEANEPELSPPEAINLATRRMATALIVAGLAIALGIWARPSPPRYQAFATPDGIVRVNTGSGTVILCRAGGKCGIVLRKGQHLEGGKSFTFDFSDKTPAVAPPTAAAAPAPQLAPAAPAAK
jgi:hypothetical protein